jgi:N-sulfoglucosamine sulfohydrolase
MRQCEHGQWRVSGHGIWAYGGYLAGVSTLLLAVFAGPVAGAEKRVARANRLNVLLITADDMNWDSPGCMGGTAPDITPNIDRLASEGVRFMNAQVSIAVCTPSRSVWLTGRYPHRSGVEGFQRIRPDVPTLPAVLTEAGYLCGIVGKPLGQEEKFRWAASYRYAYPGDEDMWGRDPAIYYRFAKNFFAMAVAAEQPFFLMANSHDPHRPFPGSADELKPSGPGPREAVDPSRTYGAAEVTVPGFLPELPAVREEVAQYFSAVRRFDDTMGQVLQALDESGQADNTVVMFLSDHGMSFPFAKTNCYPQSTHIPWVIRWPGRIEKGAVDTQHLVAGVDLMPTVLEMVGVSAPAGMDGTSLVPLLMGEAPDWREMVFTQFHHIHGRRPYPMRAVITREFAYIFNPWSDGERVYKAEPLDGMTFAAMVAAAKTDPAVAARVEMVRHRMVEEFYDLRKDPCARENLIDGDASRSERKALQDALRAWMKRTGDPALEAFEGRKSPGALERFMRKYTEKARKEIQALKAYETSTGYFF